MAFVKTTIDKADLSSDHLFSDDSTIDFVICKSPEKLNSLLKAIKPGSNVFYVCNGDWSAHDLVMQLVKQYQPVELFMTSYAIREYAIRLFIGGIDNGSIKQINMLLDHRATVRTPEVYQLAKANFTKIYLSAVHAKVCIIRHSQGCISIVGSANFTKNPKIESGVVSTNTALGEWYIDHLKKLMDGADIFG